MSHLNPPQPSRSTYAIKGARIGAILALGYGLIVTCITAIGVSQSIQQYSTTAHGLLADTLFTLLGIALPALVVIILIGVIPSIILGSLTALCIRWASRHWNHQASGRRAWVIGVSTASIFATAVVSLLLVLNIEPARVGVLLGPAGLLYILASGWGSWRLQTYYRNREQHAT